MSARYDQYGRRLCSAHRTDGERCNGPAVKGTTVCNVHGARAPNVQAAAARVRLEELIGPALAALAGILDDPEVSAAARVTAAKVVLDRSGYGPTRRVVEITEAALDAEIARLEAELDEQQPGWRDDQSAPLGYSPVGSGSVLKTVYRRVSNSSSS